MRDQLFTPLAKIIGRDRRGPGRPHFVFRANNKTIAYAYIRKNGCTAFKNLITSCSEHPVFYDSNSNPLQFMLDYHEERSLTALEKCDYRIFVYRDPYDRIASLFLNKIVERKNAEDLRQSIRSVSDKNPEKMSMYDFVFLYLRSGVDVEKLDPHVWPQSTHLYPIKYTNAISIANLKEEMASIVGKDLSQRFFANKSNAASGNVMTNDTDLSKVSAYKLRETLETTGVRPSTRNLIGADESEAIRLIYRYDVELIKKLEGSHL